MAFWNKICGFTAFFLLWTLVSGAQTGTPSDTISFQKSKKLFSSVHKAYNTESLGSSTLSPIPANYYTQHFGFMCKKELAIEKAIKIPFRFRLGSLQQCIYLEGKK